MDKHTPQPGNQVLPSDAALRNGLQRMGVSIEAAATARLGWYLNELLRWSSRMNLVSRASVEDIVENHFLDSLALLPLLAGRQGQTILDVGSGAGFPGLVLKTAHPDLRVTLVEPREKRAGFLRHISRGLALPDIEIVSCRLPAGNDPNHPLAGRTFDLITSRALAATTEFLEMVEEFVPADGKVICMKGPKADEEIKAWQESGKVRPLSLSRKLAYSLPSAGTVRYLLIFTRNSPPAIR